MKYILLVQWKDGSYETIFFSYISQAKEHAESLILMSQVKYISIYALVHNEVGNI